MHFKELNKTHVKSYVIACSETGLASLVDPDLEFVDRYFAYLSYRDFTLESVINTHTHADFRSGASLMGELLDVPVIMHRKAPNPTVSRHVAHGDVIQLGRLEIHVLHTPGHTPDSLSLYCEDRVMTGDTLLIQGTGRTDFAGGDTGDQYDSIVQHLFTLPDETLVFPGHDYRGNTVSTIGRERQTNPRIAGKSRDEYIALMESIHFPLPTKIQEVLQPNQTAIDDDRISFPSLAELNEVRQLTPETVHQLITEAPEAPILLDVRESAEFDGELGHIVNSRLIPLRELSDRVHELGEDKSRKIVAICRSGVRSTTAAAILAGLGYLDVSNLKGGMLDWGDAGLPVHRKES